MTLVEFYEKIGGNYDEVIGRLLKDTRIEKYIFLFLQSEDFESLTKAVEAKDYEQAFLSAHTIKGVAVNLGFSVLAAVDSELTELLRPREVSDEVQLKVLYNKVAAEYRKTIDLIQEYKAGIV